MSEPIEVQTKAEPIHAPYKCPACGKWADEIQCTNNTGLLVFWHNHCKAIIGLQLLKPPEQMRSSIVVPGGVH